MTNLSRITAKIFGETAATTGDDPEIGQFGSALAGTYVGTADVATIQSLPAWSNGFIDSVTPSTQFPPLPEVTGFGKVLSYQNAYLLQKGIAEWDSATVYYTTSYCQYNGALYRSKINNNVGNEPVIDVSNDYWQFLGKDFLNTQQVTNCLLEVPNNIKLELNNGVLTLKAGSKVIVPNGFEQDGVTPKFDEITIESDMTNNETHSSVQTVMVWLNSAHDGIGTRPIANCYSGSTRPSGQTAMVWYNTNNNIMKNTINSGSTWITGQSLPFCIATVGSTGFTSINQVFNGFGYIGSIVWADKGIKGLIPNGRNADGSLNNTEYTTENITVRSTDPTSNYQHFLIMRESQPNIVMFGGGILSYDPKQNYNFYYSQNANTIYSGLIAGTLTLKSGRITGFTINNALNINSMCDGQWADVNVTLASGVATPTTSDLVFNISSYLPSDNFNYEIFLGASIVTGATSGNYAWAAAYSSLHGSVMQICQARTRTAATALASGTITLPVGSDRQVFMNKNSSNTGTMNVYLRGYRRIGTNS